MARGGSAARRYAEAAFEVAGRDRTYERWRDELSLAAQVIGAPEVARIVGSKNVPLVDREALIQRALGTQVQPQVLNLIRLFLRRDKLDLLPAVAIEFKSLLNRRQGIVQALVTSASPLTAQEDAAVRDKVTRLAGAEVDLSTRVDPALIGGLTVRIGDRLIDASVRGRLERLREDLLARSR
jgi:F-type H+-transporting ATPase subunit delta